MTRRAKLIRNIAIGFYAFSALLFVAAIVTVHTNWFREFVKGKIIAATEEATGGKVEIGTFTFDWTHLRAIATDFVVHGKEPPGTTPWLRARRIQVDLRLFAGLSQVVSLSYLGLDRPEAAVVVFPDGTTNIPTPKPTPVSNTTALESVVDLAVGHFELTNGLLAFNSQKQAVNLRGENLRAQLWYNALKRGYQGRIELEPLYVVSGRNTPVKFSVSLPLELGRDRIDMRGGRISTAASQLLIDASLDSLRNPQASAHVSGRLALADLKNAGNVALSLPAGETLSAVDLDASAAVAGNAIQVKRLHLAMGHSNIDASGMLKDPAGKSSLEFDARLAVGELGRLARVTARPDGLVSISGTARLDKTNTYLVTGKIEGKDLSFQAGAQRILGMSLSSSVRLDPHRLDLADLRVAALSGELAGKASLEDFARFQLKVDLRHLDLRTAASAMGQNNLGYAGIASGPITAEGDLNLPGTKSLNAQARIALAPGPRGIPVSGRLSADYSGAADTINVNDSYVALPHTRVTANGSLGKKVEISVTTHDLNDLLAMSPGNTKPPVSFSAGGQAALTSTVTGSLSSPHITAHLAANRFMVQDRSFDALALDAAASSAGATVSNGSLTRRAMQAQFTASVGLRNWKAASNQPLSGSVSVRNADLADVLVLAGRPSTDFSGALVATANMGGTVGNPLGSANLSITNGTIQGEPFDQIQAQVKMADRLITIPAAYVTAGQARATLAAEFRHPKDSFSTGQLHARLQTTAVNLQQFRTLQKQLPDTSGEVQIQAEASGNLAEAQSSAGQQTEFLLTSVSTDASARGLRFNGQNYGDFHATAQTQQKTVHYQVTSNFAGSKISLNGNTELTPDYPTNADARIDNLAIERVLALAKRPDLPAKGVLSCSARFAGTVKKPEGNLELDLSHAVLYGEPIDHVRAKLTYALLSVEVSQFEVISGPSNLVLTAKYDHPADDLQAGNLRFQVHSSRVDLARVRNIQKARPGLSGTFQISASGAATMQHGQTPVRLQKLDANVAVSGIAAQGKSFGDATLTANTSGGRLNFALDSNLAHASIHGHGNADLGGDYPLNAELAFNNITWTGLQGLLGPGGEPSNFEAVADGQATVNGPATKTNEMRATLKLTRVNVTATAAGAGRGAVAIQNQGPITLALDRGTARIESFHLTGQQMDLQAQGTASLQTKALNIGVQANTNLAVANSLDRNVVSSGNVALAATVRGDLTNPLINGKLEFHDASLSYTEFPNGISHANGVVQFNGNSASIKNLTAETGGGKLTLGGYVAIRDEVRFGLRATASKVRVRPQEGISVLLDANLNVAGTAQSSTASGLVTVNRITYAPQSDIGSLLSRAPQPVNSSSTPSPLLAKMKLDIRVRTATSMAVRASVAQNLQADADLQIRGTLSQPGMLGRVNISEGQLVFFNSTYTINSGTISFYNPVRIEPVLNLSLNTQAKGVDVVLTVTGPVDNMKLTYTSDPPLQFQEIVNLLASGKTPTSDPTILANQPADPPQSFTQMGESAVVSKAIADPLASRLQRVFGVSQLSVDPVFTSGSDLPQARVTLQQRISNNMTFTYVTALNAPNTEIIRAEWTLNPQWAAQATRDENGILSVRLTYKKQFR